MHFGIRKNEMGTILNGMALHRGHNPYGGTFFVSSDYIGQGPAWVDASAVIAMCCATVFRNQLSKPSAVRFWVGRKCLRACVFRAAVRRSTGKLKLRSAIFPSCSDSAEGEQDEIELARPLVESMGERCISE
jgi:hypothetical protein